MARSKVTTPKGKKVTPKKKRDTKRKASVHHEEVNAGPGRASARTKIIRINDGDPTVYSRGRRSHESKKAARPNAFRHTTTSPARSQRANSKKIEKQYPRK